MKKTINVFKFGGASIKDIPSIQNVANILNNYPKGPLLIVVSAMGKTTNKLEALLHSHANRDGKSAEHLNALKQEHYAVLEGLFPAQHEIYDTINDTFVEIEWMLEEEPHDQFDYMYDQMVSVGELLSSRIVAAYLSEVGLPTQWLDARDVILTDNIYRSAGILWEETQERCNRMVAPLLEQEGFILTQGFIGSTSENFTTTLGREGSDYTAAIFSWCLNAESMSIWKDVPGVLTADPRLFDNVTKLDRLSYKEAIEMTYYGAKVIHPKTIQPIQDKQIPLYVKSFVHPEGSGTFISNEVEDNYPAMVAVKAQQVLLNVSTLDFSFVAEHHMLSLFTVIANLGLQVNMMQNTAISFGLCLNDEKEKMDKLVAEIEKDFNVILERDVELVTVRYYHLDILNELKRGKIVLLEGRIQKTIQMVMKSVPLMKRKT